MYTLDTISVALSISDGCRSLAAFCDLFSSTARPDSAPTRNVTIGVVIAAAADRARLSSGGFQSPTYTGPKITPKSNKIM